MVCDVVQPSVATSDAEVDEVGVGLSVPVETGEMCEAAIQFAEGAGPRHPKNPGMWRDEVFLVGEGWRGLDISQQREWEGFCYRLAPCGQSPCAAHGMHKTQLAASLWPVPPTLIKLHQSLPTSKPTNATRAGPCTHTPTLDTEIHWPSTGLPPSPIPPPHCLQT